MALATISGVRTGLLDPGEPAVVEPPDWNAPNNLPRSAKFEGGLEPLPNVEDVGNGCVFDALREMESNTDVPDEDPEAGRDCGANCPRPNKKYVP